MNQHIITLAAACAFTSLAANDSKPNIVFILSDDVGIGDIKSFYRESKVTTPNIDKLASRGMKFTNAYAPGSVCSPSRYALMTGAYPCRGPLRDKSARATSPLTIGLDMITLSNFMKSQGYRTAHIGKWHLGYGKNGTTNWAEEIKPGPLEIGFDYHFGLPGNHNDNYKTYVENHNLLWLKEGVTKIPRRPKKEQLTQIRYDDEVDSTLTEKAIDFMKTKSDKPFFVYLAFVATHTHITPHKRFRGTSQIGQLGDYINELDFHVGEIMNTLDNLGITDNTIVFFSSDNGGQKDDLKSAGKNLDLKDDSYNVAEKSKTAKTVARTKFEHKTNGDLRGYKASNYEGGFRVPFIVSWPGKIKAGTTSKQMISLVDVLATSAGLLGKALPENAAVDSFDLSSEMLGKPLEKQMRKNIILQTGHGVLAYRNENWKLCFTKEPKWENKKITFPNAPYELYNLANDPAERTNLAEQNPKQLESMKKELMDLIDKGRTRP